MTKNQPRATLLTPNDEYKDYEKYCEKEKITPVSEVAFYKAYAYLSIGALVSGMPNGISSYDLGDIILCLCEMEEKTLVLAIFEKDTLENLQKEENTVDPIDHLG